MKAATEALRYRPIQKQTDVIKTENTQPPSAESSSLEERVAAIEDRLGRIEDLLRQMGQRSRQPDPELVDPVAIRLDAIEEKLEQLGKLDQSSFIPDILSAMETSPTARKDLFQATNGPLRVTQTELMTGQYP